MTEWRPGNTKDAPSNRAWDSQVSGGKIDAPEPQVVQKGKTLRIHREKK